MCQWYTLRLAHNQVHLQIPVPVPVASSLFFHQFLARHYEATYSKKAFLVPISGCAWLELHLRLPLPLINWLTVYLLTALTLMVHHSSFATSLTTTAIIFGYCNVFYTPYHRASTDALSTSTIVVVLVLTMYSQLLWGAGLTPCKITTVLFSTSLTTVYCYCTLCADGVPGTRIPSQSDSFALM